MAPAGVAVVTGGVQRFDAIPRVDEEAPLPPRFETWQVGLDYAVVVFDCPQCNQEVARTVVHEDATGEISTRTTLTLGDAVHVADADRDGVPFYGPTRRGMRGKTLRRRSVDEERLAIRRAWARENGTRAVLGDHTLIAARVFDTLCDNCPLRVRVTVPTP